MTCENEWRRLGYKDERTWPHLFPSTLADLPSKWYKMEEARGETFFWHELKENFIKDFQFILKMKNWLGQHTKSNSFTNRQKNNPPKTIDKSRTVTRYKLNQNHSQHIYT